LTRNRNTGREGERKIPALSLLTKAKPLHSEGQNESEGESKGSRGREVSEKDGKWERQASEKQERQERGSPTARLLPRLQDEIPEAVHRQR
jgi:hypothetical protein